MIISLTGFMGCGKSSVGRKLSELLCCRFIDLDSVIEKKTGRSIPEIFSSDGEGVFRQMEVDELSEIIAGNTLMINTTPEEILVIALGGGTVMTPECKELVKSQTLCIYLRASIDTLVRNLEGGSERRPMLQSGHNDGQQGETRAAELPENTGTTVYQLRKRVENLMALRSDTYEYAAEIIIDTDGMSIEETAQKIFNGIR